MLTRSNWTLVVMNMIQKPLQLEVDTMLQRMVSMIMTWDLGIEVLMLVLAKICLKLRKVRVIRILEWISSRMIMRGIIHHISEGTPLWRSTIAHPWWRKSGRRSGSSMSQSLLKVRAKLLPRNVISWFHAMLLEAHKILFGQSKILTKTRAPKPTWLTVPSRLVTAPF